MDSLQGVANKTRNPPPPPPPRPPETVGFLVVSLLNNQPTHGPPILRTTLSVPWAICCWEVWTRVLWVLRVPPDKHAQFRGITSIKGITSMSSSTGSTSSHGCGFARHTSPNKTDSDFFSGPSPVLQAFSGFAGLLRVCVLPQPLRVRSFLFLSF